MPQSPAAEVFQDLTEEEAELFGEVDAARMVDPAKVDCARLDRSWPIFRAIGTTDPVGVLETVCRRAVEMLDNTIAELTRIRERVRAGEPPAFPLIGDRLGWSLQTRMLMRANQSGAWTGTGPRTAEQILRWLTNSRKTIANGSLWFTCLWSGCDTDPDTRAASVPGRLRVLLCRPFWLPLPGIDEATNLGFQAQTIIHEVSHIYYETEDAGLGPGSAHCIAQFVADANGTRIHPGLLGLCGPAEPTPQRETGEEANRGALHEETPFPWPQWPTSRSFNRPPPRIIPAGSPRTFSPCDAVADDAIKLSLAVDDLKNQLRQRPPNRQRVNNRSDVVRALSRQIVARLEQLVYARAGCSRVDLGLLARSVATARGGGNDADIGSWPPAGSPAAQEPRRAARESLRHLLAWARRAAQFPENMNVSDRNLPLPGAR
jgi:hypothetical protein